MPAFGDDPRSVFAGRLNALWKLAGDPPAKVVLKNVRVSPQRLSDWRHRKAVPHDPATFAQLIEALKSRVPTADRARYPLLVDLAAWQALRRQAAAAPKGSVLEQARTAATGPPEQRSGPAGLPTAPAAGVVGRDDAVRTILGMATAGSTPISVHGGGGLGKTTVAAEVGRHALRTGAFPGGILWADVGPAPRPRLILESWGREFGVDLLAEPDVESCQQRLRNAIGHRRILFIIDDVWDLAGVRPLRVGGLDSATIVTTRDRTIAYDLSTPRGSYALDVLTEGTSLQLLGLLAPGAVEAYPQDSARLCAKVGHLPLAITLAGGLLAERLDMPNSVQRMLQLLAEDRAARLGMQQDEPRPGIDTGPVDIRAVLGLSVSRLPPHERLRFTLLGSLPHDAVTWDLGMAAAVWECAEPEAEDTLASLLRRSLVEARADGFRLHDLTADYARELFDERFPE